MNFVDDFNVQARALEKEAAIPETAGMLQVLRGGTREEAKAVEGAVRRRFQKMRRPINKRIWDVIKKLEAPATARLRKARVAEGMGPGVPSGMQKKLMRAGRYLVENPEQIPLQFVPVPGISPMVGVGKKGYHAVARRIIEPARPA